MTYPTIITNQGLVLLSYEDEDRDHAERHLARPPFSILRGWYRDGTVRSQLFPDQLPNGWIAAWWCEPRACCAEDELAPMCPCGRGRTEQDPGDEG